MELSNKKRKYIERFATRKPAETIAGDLKLPLELVKREIEKKTGRPVLERVPVLEKLCWALFLAVALLLPFPIFQTTFDYANYPKTIFLQLGVLVLLAVWLLHCRREKSFSVLKCPLYLPLGVGFAWGGLNILLSNYAYLSLVQWIHWFACGLVFFLAVQLLHRPKRNIQLMSCLLLSGFLVSAMGILQYLIGLDWVHQNASPAATFANRNMATHYVVGTLPAAMLILGTCRGKIFTWISATVLAAMLIFVYFTVTRAAWLAISCQFFFLGAYFLWDRLRHNSVHRMDFKKIGAFAIAVMAVFCVAYLPNLKHEKKVRAQTETVAKSEKPAPDKKQRLAKLTNTSSMRFRLIYWENTLKMIEDHPLTGIGVQNFRAQYPNYHEAQREDNELNLFKAPRYAHNDFIQLAAELGIPGFLVLLWSGFLLFKMSWRVFFLEEGKSSRLMAINHLVALLGIGLVACFSSPFYRATPPYLIAVHIALLVRLTPWPGKKQINDKGGETLWTLSHTLLAVGCAAISILLAIYWGALQHRWVKADGFYEYQRFSIDQQDWKNAIRFGEKVRKHNPYRADTLNASGAALLKSHKYKEAKEILERYVGYFPNSPSALFYLGQCYENLRAYDKAIATLSHAAKIVPYEGWVHRILGRVLLAKGKKEEALEEYRLATSSTPGNRSFHFFHGRLATEFGLHEEAAEQHLKAVEADENWDNAQKYLGLVLYNEMGQTKKGVEHMKKALQLNPKIHQAKKLKALIKQFETSSQAEPESSSQ